MVIPDGPKEYDYFVELHSIVGKIRALQDGQCFILSIHYFQKCSALINACTHWYTGVLYYVVMQTCTAMNIKYFVAPPVSHALSVKFYKYSLFEVRIDDSINLMSTLS